jgi:C4-dicarboxylate-specific signal transduction histidine kinase
MAKLDMANPVSSLISGHHSDQVAQSLEIIQQFVAQIRNQPDGRCSALRRQYAELESRAAEQIRELTAINDALRLQIAQCQQIADEQRRAYEESIRVARATTAYELARFLSHTIGQPLAATVANGAACVRWLERAQPELQQAIGAARRSEDEALRAGTVIAQTRAYVGRLAEPWSPFDMARTIRTVMMFFEAECERCRIEVRTSLDPDPQPVKGDRVRIQQVLFSLVENAIEAMSQVEARRELQILCEHHALSNKQGALVTIADTGVGIAQENLARVFDGLFTTKPNHLGLGLAASRSIIEAHGGLLWADPDRDCGALLRFFLPESGLGPGQRLDPTEQKHE